MPDPDAFDAFYQGARDRLLLQTYALTGDLAGARTAVRDAFVSAWHHWRKVSPLEDPESWVRAQAWAHAQRRHPSRLWHRDRGDDPVVTRTLDALGRLPAGQRRLLLLSHLTTLSLDEVAREAGLTRAGAERELQTAETRFALHRDVPSTALRPLFEPLREQVSPVRWPRATILRRAGAARRRTHTTVGAVAAVAALVVTGWLVTDVAGVRPTLDREALTSPRASGGADAAATSASPATPPTLPASSMLSAAAVASVVDGGRWTTTGTVDNTRGNGLAAPCQQARYADPQGEAALVRTFVTRPRRSPGGPGSAASAVQTAEVSRSPGRARRSFGVAAGWYAGCTDPRVQLLSTQRVRGAGDQAVLLVLRAWDRPVTTLVVGVARTGAITTTTLTRVASGATPDVRRSARLLATAVQGLCGLPDGGGCPVQPRVALAPSPPLPVGDAPALLGEVDLPPLPGVDRPWVGTAPAPARTNVAATSCDRASFAAPVANGTTRSFVVPRSRLAAQFGLTETVGSLPERRAAAFVAAVRARMAACPRRDLGTHVASVRQVHSARRDLAVWRITSELSDRSTISYLMGIVRDGTSIAQVGFVPDNDVGISPAAFAGVVQRALDRVGALPPPGRPG